MAQLHPPAPKYQQPYPYPYPYPPTRPTNGFAIASLVLGIVWLGGVGSVLAMIFSFVSMRQIAERGEGGRGMAIAGMVLGAVGIMILIGVILIMQAAADTADKYQNICLYLDATGC